MKLKAAPAVLAVGPDGVVDIDMVRRNKPGAKWAASNITGRAWPQLERDGWVILSVVVMPVADVTGDEPLELTRSAPAAEPAPTAPRKAKRAPKPTAGGSPVVRFAHTAHKD